MVDQSEQQAVPVAQEDREALIQHWIGKGFPTREVAAEMINGWPDTAPVLQMLARHRLSATSLHDMQITPALSLPCKSGEGAGERWGLDADALALLKKAATFLDSAAGEGLELDGIDAMDLVTDLHELVDVDASNCFHEDAALFLDGKILGTEPEVATILPAVEALIAWARDNQAFPVGNPGGAGRGHIDENGRFVLRDLVSAIDATPDATQTREAETRSAIVRDLIAERRSYKEDSPTWRAFGFCIDIAEKAALNARGGA